MYQNSLWQDWTYCDWGEDGICPVQFLLFLDLTCLKTENIDVNAVILEAGCKYALIHMIAQPLHEEKGNSIFRADEKSWIFFKTQKMIDNDTMAPTLACISIDGIMGPWIAIPFDLNALTNRYFLFLKTQSALPNVLVDAMKEGLSEDMKL
jgi:hypothetical protein